MFGVQIQRKFHDLGPKKPQNRFFEREKQWARDLLALYSEMVDFFTSLP